jgi:anti-sigma28 factor (negative regulator of flagellin synthesis)
MKNDFKNEKWAVVKPPFKFTNNLKIEVSNFGRIRTSTKIAEKRILKGTLINGYPIVRFKLFQKRSADVQKALDNKRNRILQLTGKIKNQQAELKTLKRGSGPYAGLKKQIENAHVELNGLKESYRKAFRKDELERTINYAPLIHRLVAENFVRKPSAKHSIVAHLDHNKRNNHYSNLKWMTQSDNIEHQKKSPVVIKEKKNRIGKRPANATGYKLNEKKVAEIKKRINKGEALSKISSKFDVSETQLLRIKRGINWGDVKVPK